MRPKIIYEWDVEEYDEDGEILDHNFYKECPSVPTEPNKSLVLIRDVVHEFDGVIQRNWAYVTNGKLPEFFDNTFIKIPNKYHKELNK